VKIDNSSFERVEEFKYLVTTLTNQNSIQEEIKSRLKSGNACYYSVQNLFSSSLVSKNLKNLRYFYCYIVHVVELLNYYTDHCTYIKFIKFKHCCAQKIILIFILTILTWYNLYYRHAATTHNWYSEINL